MFHKNTGRGLASGVSFLHFIWRSSSRCLAGSQRLKLTFESACQGLAQLPLSSAAPNSVQNSAPFILQSHTKIQL